MSFLSMISFSDKWVSASVRRNIRRGFLENPIGVLERVRRKNRDAVIQVFDAGCVVSVKQIHATAVATHLAFKAGTNVSRKFEIELLVRLAADTQINRVLDRLGVKADTEEVGCCVVAESRDKALKAFRDLLQEIGGEEIEESELRSEERLKKAMEFYGIGESEVESVQAQSRYEAILLLILERIATLDLRR